MPPKNRSLYQTVWVYYSAAVRAAECVWASFGVCVCARVCVCSMPGSCCSTLALSWLCVAVTLCVFMHLCVFVLCLSASPWHRNHLTCLVTIQSGEMRGVPRAWRHWPDHTSVSHSLVHPFPCILNPFFFHFMTESSGLQRWMEEKWTRKRGLCSFLIHLSASWPSPPFFYPQSFLILPLNAWHFTIKDVFSFVFPSTGHYIDFM